jgi:hypothetical protein
MRIHNVRFKVTTAFLAIALIAGAAVLSLSQGPGVAAADSGTADVTFTKWVTQATAFPWDMKGVVGGDVDTGTFTGEILTRVDDGTTTKIHALYHINGAKQSLTADLQVSATDATGAAVLNGVVTVGYLKDSQVAGEYKTLATCDIPTPGNVLGAKCFKGTLHITAPTATFTKWVTQATAFPWDMKGVIGGDVGTGTFTGEVLTRVDDGTTTKIHALYHANGGKQSLTADLQVSATDATGAAVLNGVVTVGYLKDAQVTGEYKTLTTCDIPTPGNVFGTTCFKGTLRIIAAPATAPAVAPTTVPTVAPPVAATTPAPAAPAAPRAGTGFAKSDESSSASFSFFGGLALTLAGAAGLSAVALRRSWRSPRR